MMTLTIKEIERRMKFHDECAMFHAHAYQYLRQQWVDQTKTLNEENLKNNGVIKNNKSTATSLGVNSSWLAKNIKKGDIIKVRGSKIKGPREVLVVFPTGVLAKGDTLSMKTNYLFHRITQIYRNGRFVNVSSLAKAQK
jgi:hypothetical protein